MWWITAVVGVTPIGSTERPSSAFTNVVLPWLNSPTTTRWKRSASSLRTTSRSSRSASERAPTPAATSHRPPRASITSNFRSRNASSIDLPHHLDEAVHPLVHLLHRQAVGAQSDVLSIERALAERAQREHALGQPGMGREHLAEAADALLSLFVLFEKSLEIELVVELVGAERELGQR